MLEARMSQADTLKKIIDAAKEIVNEVNLNCSDNEMKMQAMDNAHVCLVEVKLSKSGFEDGYRCDRDVPIGLNLTNLQKVFKSAGMDDEVTLSYGANDNASDVLSIFFESKGEGGTSLCELKTMDIDSEQLQIPEPDPDAEVTLPSAQFAKIVNELREFSESVDISVSKDGIRFESNGDIGKRARMLRPSDTHDEDDEEEAPAPEEDEKPNLFHDEDEDADVSRKRASDGAESRAKKAKTPGGIAVNVRDSVHLACSLKHLAKMTKCTPLSENVVLRLTANLPLMVEYGFGSGVVQYFLAPKVSD